MISDSQLIQNICPLNSIGSLPLICYLKVKFILINLKINGQRVLRVRDHFLPCFSVCEESRRLRACRPPVALGTFFYSQLHLFQRPTPITFSPAAFNFALSRTLRPSKTRSPFINTAIFFQSRSIYSGHSVTRTSASTSRATSYGSSK